MILISGTNLKVEDLPLSDIMNYAVETQEQFVKIKLKTIATSSVCLGVYLHKDLKGKYEITEAVAKKLIYFNTDDHLKTLLVNGGKEEPEPEVEQEPIEEESSVVDFGVSEQAKTSKHEAEVLELTPEPVAEVVERKTTGGFVLIETVDVESDPTDIVFSIPTIAEDTDSIKEKLVSKDRIIAQKDAQLAEMLKSLDDLYKLQDIQLVEIKDVYDKRIDEANTALSMANQKLKEAAIPEDLNGFLKFASYAQNPRASLREGYTREEIQSLGKLTSKIHVFAMAAGDSNISFMKSLNDLIERKPNALIVDFSNDQSIISRQRIKPMLNSIHLKDPEIDVATVVHDLKGTMLIPTGVYNDIALLTMDWLNIIKRLDRIAKGRPIIFIFNSINSFAVRYTFSKLSTIGEGSVFVKCNPVILMSAFSDMSFIPENRFRVVALNHFDGVNTILERISKTHKTVAFKDGIDWKKIGVNV